MLDGGFRVGQVVGEPALRLLLGAGLAQLDAPGVADAQRGHARRTQVCLLPAPLEVEDGGPRRWRNLHRAPLRARQACSKRISWMPQIKSAVTMPTPIVTTDSQPWITSSLA